MKDIKKYFDGFFKDLRELSKQVRNAKVYNIRANVDPVNLSEELKQLTKKVYNSIRYKHNEID